jgi:hypothetical protein
MNARRTQLLATKMMGASRLRVLFDHLSLIDTRSEQIHARRLLGVTLTVIGAALLQCA